MIIDPNDQFIHSQQLKTMSTPISSDDYIYYLEEMGFLTNKAKICGYGIAHIYVKCKSTTDYIFFTTLKLNLFHIFLNMINLIYPLPALEYFYKLFTSRMNPLMIPSGIVLSIALMFTTISCYALITFLATNFLLSHQHRILFKFTSRVAKS